MISRDSDKSEGTSCVVANNVFLTTFSKRNDLNRRRHNPTFLSSSGLIKRECIVWELSQASSFVITILCKYL